MVEKIDVLLLGHAEDLELDPFLYGEIEILTFRACSITWTNLPSFRLAIISWIMSSFRNCSTLRYMSAPNLLSVVSWSLLEGVHVVVKYK